VGFRLRPAETQDDKGGKPDWQENSSPKGVLGVRGKDSGDFIELKSVFAGSAAEQAGLSVGDKVIAIDGRQLTLAQMRDYVARKFERSPVEVQYLRRGELHAASVTPLPAPADTCDLWLESADRLDRKIQARRSSWLNLKG
jgi:predicted metalloprotease with PDZ domain